MLRLSLWVFLLLNLAATLFSSDIYSRDDFPPDFIFGSGTSAYQVEGAANEDGRTPSIWDTFTHAGIVPGNGDTACDEYHKYKESNHMLHYTIVIYHRHSKMSMEDGKDFTLYADACFREFGDRVLYWTTINEGNIFALAGYDTGMMPPLRCSPPFGFNCSKGNSSTEPYLAAHYILLAHASAAQLYKKKYQDKQHGFIGLNLYAFGMVPLTNTTEDVIATQRAKDFFIGWFMEPLLFGDYPNIMKKNAGSRIPAFTSDESKMVKGSFDFLGLNHYNTLNIKDNPSSLKMDHRDLAGDMAAELIFMQDDPSAFEFPSRPEGLQGVLEYFKQAYGNPPIYIHENGQRTQHNASLNDTRRVEYMKGFIGSLLDAVRNGSNARGYFTWSFLDVLELLDGYESSYGMYYVDLEDPDLKRYPKLSAHWYSDFLKGRSTHAHGMIEVEKNSSALSHAHFVQ
ncbi:hypothetical protein L1049_004205 [Liquidambar formosana]|uniref:Beta-glucosidase 11-like n=1 Tax=Liquidambar formosana TaxID=63359 RepID=A0AAP0RMX6_LIQFO